MYSIIEKLKAYKRKKHRHHHRRHREDFMKVNGPSSNTKRKWRRFYAKNETIIKRLSIGLLFFVILGVAALFDNMDYNPEKAINSTSSVYIEVPVFERETTLVNTAIEDYLSNDVVSAHDVWSKYKGFVQRLDEGLPLTFAYKTSGLTGSKTVSQTKIEISENENFTDSRVFFSKKPEDSVDIYHLKTNTKYYYRVSMDLSDGTESVREGLFKTSDTPRILSIDGLVNVRDIGNWETTDKKRVKQGLLYRGSEPDGAVEADYCLTQKGAEDMLITLGIKTDMDLRSPGDKGDGVDFYYDKVEHIYYDVPMYTDIFLPKHTETIRKIFSDLARPEKYPVYLHCTYGRDRTGVICYLLSAMLGVEERQIVQDYELTTLYDGYLEADKFSKFVTQFKRLSGSTIQDKAINYLKSTGVTDEEISSIQSIFLD